MANFDELYDMINGATYESMFEIDDDMDTDDIAYIESCRDLTEYLEKTRITDNDGEGPSTFREKLSRFAFNKKEDLREGKARIQGAFDNARIKKIQKDIEKRENSDGDETVPQKKIFAHLSKGEILAGVGLLAAAGVASLTVIRHKTKNKEIVKTVDDLKKEIEEIKKSAKAGEISVREAWSETRRINKEIKALEKAAEAEEKANAAEEAKKAMKESADDVRLEIYESCYYGEISEDERDLLLDLMD
jgi:cell division protein FtsL